MYENKNSKARIAANNRYNAKKYDRINIAVDLVPFTISFSFLFLIFNGLFNV